MKRALLVGIDHYDRVSGLSGCVNDVRALTPLLARNEDDSPNFACQALTSASERVDRETMLGRIERRLRPARTWPSSTSQGMGRKYGRRALSRRTATPATGVSLADVLARVQSSVPEILIILDCYFACGAGGSPQLGGDTFVMRPGLSILTASRGDQTSAETEEGRGLFSTYLGGALDGGAADVLGRVTVAGVYAYLSESFGAWDQRPTFKASVDRLHELRRCAPAVPLPELRRLFTIFSEANAELQLDPSFEPTVEPSHPD
ncbi:MAG: caspase family protein, partial [Chloroflexia bacterium]